MNMVMLIFITCVFCLGFEPPCFVLSATTAHQTMWVKSFALETSVSPVCLQNPHKKAELKAICIKLISAFVAALVDPVCLHSNSLGLIP